MTWFHTLALPLATAFAVFIGVKKQVPRWKHGALILGCALMLSGLWLAERWSTLLLLGGGALWLVGAPRGPMIRPPTPGVERPPERDERS